MVAGKGLIERSHRPRASLFALLALEVENGLPVLPDLVLWSLALSEGDLLTVRQGFGGQSHHFQSYLANLELVLDLVSQPWPYIEPMLRLPMAVIGARGTLLLPEEEGASAVRKPGAVVLRTDRGTDDLFTLQMDAEPPSSPFLFVVKEYTLPILSRDRVVLPEEALWLLGLQGGARLACKASLSQAEFEPASRAKSLKGLSWIDVEPDGTLPLPATLRRVLVEESIPYTNVQLKLTPSGFRIQLQIDLPED